MKAGDCLWQRHWRQCILEYVRKKAVVSYANILGKDACQQGSVFGIVEGAWVDSNVKWQNDVPRRGW
jgi:hypothetical protein